MQGREANGIAGSNLAYFKYLELWTMLPHPVAGNGRLSSRLERPGRSVLSRLGRLVMKYATSPRKSPLLPKMLTCFPTRNRPFSPWEVIRSRFTFVAVFCIKVTFYPDFFLRDMEYIFCLGQQ